MRRLESELHDQVKSWRLYPVVEAIQALRGVELTGAVILVAELGDLTRFDNPRQLMSTWASRRRNTPRGRGAARAGSPKPGTPTPAARWWKGRGRIATRRR